MEQRTKATRTGGRRQHGAAGTPAATGEPRSHGAVAGDGHGQGPRVAPRRSPGASSRPASASRGEPAAQPGQHATTQGGEEEEEEEGGRSRSSPSPNRPARVER